MGEHVMGMLGRDELERRLGFHPGTPATAPLYEANRAAALDLAVLWDRTLPPGRELAAAQTALQEALLWANTAVATNLAPLGAERGAQHPAAAPVEPVVAPAPAPVACTCQAPELGTAEHAMDCPVRAAAQQLPASVAPRR